MMVVIQWIQLGWLTLILFNLAFPHGFGFMVPVFQEEESMISQFF